ncbi:MAG: hypothetical protein ACRDRW_20910 [Pseudonocardiaceae bacterium]
MITVRDCGPVGRSARRGHRLPPPGSSRRYCARRTEDPFQAVFVPRRLVARNPKSRTGEAIRVVGYSAGMD